MYLYASRIVVIEQSLICFIIFFLKNLILGNLKVIIIIFIFACDANETLRPSVWYDRTLLDEVPEKLCP